MAALMTAAEVTVVLTRLGGMLVLLTSLFGLGAHALAGPPGMTVLAATLLAGVLLAAVALATRAVGMTLAAPLVSRSAALRVKSWSAGFLRQRDPDAAGRPRPRAPSTVPAAA